jgi:aminopeptidase N
MALPPPTVVSHPVDPAPYAAGMRPAELAAVAGLDDATVYTLTVEIDWPAKTVAGEALVRYTNNEAVALDALYLRLYPNAAHYEEGALEMQSVEADGTPVDFEVDETVLAVTLAAPLAPEQALTLALEFTVTVPERPDRFGHQDEVLALGHWYPLMAVYDDEGWNLDPYVVAGDAFYSEIGFYRVDVTAPADVVLATSGVEIAAVAAGADTRHTYVAPAARDFAIAASPDYRVATRTVNGTRVNSYYLPGDAAAGEDAAGWGADALQAFERLFGPYPYAELDVAETHFVVEDSPGGMEFPALVFISSEFYREGLYSPYHPIVLAHEIAHQWWYGVVGNNQVDEPWLDEAFATYASVLYAEETGGESARDEALVSQALMPYVFGSAFGSQEYPIASPLGAFDDILTYSAFVYGKGATFLHLLRLELGDETFTQLLQHHYERGRYRVLAPDAFRRSLEAVSGDAAALELYDTWVLTDTPVLEDALERLGGLPR